MGPIEKKIKEILKTEGISEETKLVLNHLKGEVKQLEPRLMNESYHQGYTDKERGKSPTWNYFKVKYNTYISKMMFGQLK
jgi:hypothetical protein